MPLTSSSTSSVLHSFPSFQRTLVRLLPFFLLAKLVISVVGCVFSSSHLSCLSCQSSILFHLQCNTIQTQCVTSDLAIHHRQDTTRHAPVPGRSPPPRRQNRSVSSLSPDSSGTAASAPKVTCCLSERVLPARRFHPASIEWKKIVVAARSQPNSAMIRAPRPTRVDDASSSQFSEEPTPAASEYVWTECRVPRCASCGDSVSPRVPLRLYLPVARLQLSLATCSALASTREKIAGEIVAEYQ